MMHLPRRSVLGRACQEREAVFVSLPLLVHSKFAKMQYDEKWRL